MDRVRWERDADVLAARVVVPDHVVSRAFVDQSVALNLRTSRYYSLNVTASRMLEVLAQSDTPAEAVTALSAELGEPQTVIERSLAGLCRELAERGLIELRDAGEG